MIAAGAPAGGAGLELGLERGARRLRRARSARASRSYVKTDSHARAGRAARRRPPHQAPTRTRTRAGARALYPAAGRRAAGASRRIATSCSSGAKAVDFDRAVPQARESSTSTPGSSPGHDRADVFMPISVQTERSGHYTNFAGVVSRFEACFREAGAASPTPRPCSRRSRAAGAGGRGMTQDLMRRPRLHRLRDGHADHLRHGR